MTMTIDPRWSIGLSLVLAILAFLSGASATLIDTGMDPATVKHVLAWTTLITGIGNCANAVLTGIPSKDNQTGFIIKGPPPPPAPPKQ
jgi:hypothetical protein